MGKDDSINGLRTGSAVYKPSLEHFSQKLSFNGGGVVTWRGQKKGAEYSSKGKGNF